MSICELYQLQLRMPDMAAIMGRAARAAAAELWRDPRERETAGVGAVVAAATIAEAASDPAWAAMCNAVGLFGLALVDSAREQMRR